MGKRRLEPIVGLRVRLRLLEATDLRRTLAWRNHPDARRWFVHSSVIDREDHQRWFARYRDDDGDFLFVIEQVPGGRPVGQVALYRVDWAAGRAEFGRLLIGEPDARGKGLAREATLLLLECAFETLGLQEVYLHVLPANTGARALYRRCGFREDGHRDGLLRMCLTRAPQPS